MANKKVANPTTKCSLKEVLDILGGKWAMPIIYTLSNGKMRFKELERNILHINTRMLVKELKNMEANGIVIREVFATVPPTVENTLTEEGEKLIQIIKDLHKWGEEYSV